MGCTRTFVEGGRTLRTLHGISHGVYGGGGRKLKRRVHGSGSDGLETRVWTGTCAVPLDLVDDDPEVFVSRRPASSDK